MCNEEEIPEHLKNRPPPTEEELWRQLDREYSEHRDFQNYCLETKEEAIGKSKPNKKKGKKAVKWRSTTPEAYDENIGIKVRAWNLIPYVDIIDQEFLAMNLEVIPKLVTDLEPFFKERRLTVEFLSKWGALSGCVGSLMTVLDVKPDSISRARAKRSGFKTENLNAHLVWYSKVFLSLKKQHGEKRADMEDKIEELIRRIMDKDLYKTEGFGRDWFK